MLERSEPPQLNFLLPAECGDNALKKSVDHYGGAFLAKLRNGRNLFDQVSLGHAWLLLFFRLFI
jgi:hypothetical protein